MPADVLAVFLLGLLRARSRDLAEADREYRSTGLVVDLFWAGVGAGNGRAGKASGSQSKPVAASGVSGGKGR